MAERNVLPNFLICGAPKTGSTALYYHLVEHPDVCFSNPKETFFFDRHYNRGAEWFADHFCHWSGESAIGEGSVFTMACSEAPERIQETLGQPKLIFILRNPVERAYSQYYFDLRRGIVDPDQSFSELIRDDDHSYRNRLLWIGKYDEHLDKFDERFDEKDYLIILHRDVKRSIKGEYKRVCRFLGVREGYVPDIEDRHNETTYPIHQEAYSVVRSVWQVFQPWLESLVPQASDWGRSLVRNTIFSSDRPPMSESDRMYLRGKYERTRERMKERIDEDLGHWW